MVGFDWSQRDTDHEDTPHVAPIDIWHQVQGLGTSIAVGPVLCMPQNPWNGSHHLLIADPDIGGNSKVKRRGV